MKRVVLDCNVLISAGLTNGVCRRVLEHILQNELLIVSTTIESEYREVFQPPKFYARIGNLKLLLMMS